jgi:hypothetical protein
MAELPNTTELLLSRLLIISLLPSHLVSFISVRNTLIPVKSHSFPFDYCSLLITTGFDILKILLYTFKQYTLYNEVGIIVIRPR